MQGLIHVIRYTEVRFAILLSGGFTSMAVINPPESKLAKRTSVRYIGKYVCSPCKTS